MTLPSVVVLLIRHGHAGEAGASYGPDTPLSDLGRAQVGAVADAVLKAVPISAIYSSPFPRALQSAEALATRTGLDPLVDHRLAEFQLPPSASPAQQSLTIWRAEHRGTTNGETLRDFSLRVSSFLEDISERHLGKAVAVYSHSGTIDAAVRWAIGLSPESSWHHDLPLSPASITELEIWPRGRVPSGAPRYIAFHRVGDDSHLVSLRGEGTRTS